MLFLKFALRFLLFNAAILLVELLMSWFFRRNPDMEIAVSFASFQSVRLRRQRLT